MNNLKYLDSGIVLESLFATAPSSLQATAILKAIESGKEYAIISPLNLSEIFYILTHRKKLSFDKVEIALQKLLEFKGLTFADLDNSLIRSSIPLACKFQIDLTDAVNKKIMDQFQINEIYSLDGHFDKFRDIIRLTQLKI